MIPVLTRETSVFVDLWNSHRIRKQKDVILPGGVPNHIFDFPEEYDLVDSGKRNINIFISCFYIKKILLFF